MRVSFVVPAYNEAATIGEVLERIAALGLDAQVVVVDDGSTDATSEIAEAAGAQVVRQPNAGKGAAIRAAVPLIDGDIVVIQDADMEYDPADVPLLIEPIERGVADVVLGSRGVEGARIEVHQPAHRELMGKLFNVLIRLLGFGDFKDTQCGFKLLRGSVARELFPALSVERFAYDVELVWEARQRGLRVVEVGVEWHNSPVSRVRPWQDAPQMFMDVLRIRFGRRREAAPLGNGQPGSPVRIPETAALRSESATAESTRAEHPSHRAR